MKIVFVKGFRKNFFGNLFRLFQALCAGIDADSDGGEGKILPSAVRFHGSPFERSAEKQQIALRFRAGVP